MSRGRRQARRAQQAAEQSANEARNLRGAIMKKEQSERAKVQKKLIRSIQGSFNPFLFLPDSNSSLGGGSGGGL